MAKRIILMALIAVAVFFAARPLCAAGVSNDPVGGTYYTAVNIWYEETRENTGPKNIPMTNYHRGTIIPVNTRVKIESYSSSKVRFATDDGSVFTLVYMPKHTNVSMAEMFNRYFSPTMTMLNQFTRDEQANIVTGKIVVGMSKKAVLIAYGYPPGHETPSLESDSWKYWENRVRNFFVYFSNDRVSSVTQP